MRFWITVGVFALLMALAWRVGRKPERAVMGVLSAGFALSIANTAINGPKSFRSIDPVLLTIDCAVWLMLCLIALRANRLWPLVVVSLQTIVLITHLSVALQTGWKKVYWGMMAYSQYSQLLIVLWGIIQHYVRERRIGRYRDWRK